MGQVILYCLVWMSALAFSQESIDSLIETQNIVVDQPFSSTEVDGFTLDSAGTQKLNNEPGQIMYADGKSDSISLRLKFLDRLSRGENINDPKLKEKQGKSNKADIQSTPAEKIRQQRIIQFCNERSETELNQIENFPELNLKEKKLCRDQKRKLKR